MDLAAVFSGEILAFDLPIEERTYAGRASAEGESTVIGSLELVPVVGIKDFFPRKRTPPYQGALCGVDREVAAEFDHVFLDACKLGLVFLRS